MIDELIEEALPTILSKDCSRTCISYEDLRLFDLASTIGELATTHLKPSYWVSNYEHHPPLASSSIPPSVFSPPNLKLKPLPNLIKCAALGPKGTLPVIISSILSHDQERELIHVLAEHKGGPTICMSIIHIENDAKPIRQMQRRLNPI